MVTLAVAGANRGPVSLHLEKAINQGISPDVSSRCVGLSSAVLAMIRGCSLYCSLPASAGSLYWDQGTGAGNGRSRVTQDEPPSSTSRSAANAECR